MSEEQMSKNEKGHGVCPWLSDMTNDWIYAMAKEGEFRAWEEERSSWGADAVKYVDELSQALDDELDRHQTEGG